MMRPTRIDARGQSRDGTAVLAYLKETEFQLTATPAMAYYAEHPESAAVVRQTSRWLGTGAATLGLSGAVESDAMDQLAHGFDPTTGDALSQTAGRAAQWMPKLDASGQPMLTKQGLPKGTWRGGHRVGFDCTFSIAPKSVSLAFAAATAEERVAILDALRDAVAQAFAVMEMMVETGRDHGGVRKIGVRGLVASGFTHFSSRELEPQLHEHVLVYAVGQGVDGQWGGYEALSFFEDQAMYGALARAAFAKNLEGLGYGIVKKTELDAFGRTTGETSFELAGVSEATCEKFSTRRKQILAYVEKHGTTKQQAALATRKHKEEPSFEEVDRLWQEALSRARADDPTMFKSAADLKGLESQLASISDHEVLDRLQAKDAVWTRQQLIAQLARENVGLKDVSEIIAEAHVFLERMAPHLVRINPERPPETLHSGRRTGKKFEEPRYCSRDWLIGVEAAMVSSARKRSIERHQAVSKKALAEAIERFQTERGFVLTAEQHRAVEHVTNKSGVVVLTGRAGTGKTTVADVYTRAFQAEGREVIGVSLSWNAALKLGEETGLDRVYSTAKLLSELDQGKLVLSKQHVVIVDEAAMADTLTVSRILVHAEKGAKVVLQGDAQQLSPVAAGQAFRLLRDALGDAELTEIRRQKAVEDIETSNAFYAHASAQRGTITPEEQRALGANILARLQDRNQIERTDTRQEAIEQLIQDYFDSPLDHADKLVMGSTNADVAELNKALRLRLIEGGAVAEQEHIASLKKGRRRVDIPLAKGDRVRFGRLDEDLGVTNGTIGTVEGIRATVKGSLTLRVRLDGTNRLVKLDTATYGDLDYAYARTVDKAQGATVTRSFFLASAERMDVHLGLVAATRHRENFKLYATESDLELIEERLGVERLRVNALEEGRYVEPSKPQVTLNP
jgi:conjugative relaxase-like TrwC/TraI family protein